MDYSKIILSNLSPPGYFKIFANRLNTMKYVTNLMNEDKRKLARDGFYFEANEFKCAYCCVSMNKYNIKTLKYHLYSNCTCSLQQLREKEALRKSSFKQFGLARKRYNNVMASELSKNGFFYCGTSKEVQCCECKLAVLRLNKSDTFQKVHNEYSPTCSFNTINDTTKLVNDHAIKHESFDHVIEQSPPPSAPPQNLLHSNSSGKNGLNNNDYALTAPLYPTLPRLNFESHQSFFNATNANVVESEKRSINEDVKNTNDNKICQICLDNDRQICFLPCGHVSTCEICAKKCKKCCICRETIKNKIKVYL
ncbi:iap-2 [Sucra jujuba nucleopolyhedrovirus]|uniref:Iap-2 n=1 Tax=Sucra jujuba nucleopolyhedrovirus TaxID=1563660 RepID=A0A097P8Z9_9ABAC|nr:iap-2 [Sucra jujuba nucleopolyhedrovirus]AIU41298.1 iap-2 [Sucra jujuba nucleopolyhedrovirus]